MNQKRKDKISNTLGRCPTNDATGGLLAYAGPIAEYIEVLERSNQNRCNEILALEKRIDALENPRLVPMQEGVSLQAPGLSVVDIIKLVRELRGKEQSNQPGHNVVSRLCRVALVTLGKELRNWEIYNFAQGYNGGWSLVEESVVRWAQEQS